MTADSRAKHRGRSRDLRVAQSAGGMDGDARSRPPDRRRSSKNKAPPPPVLKGLDAPLLSQKLSAYPHTAMDQKENLLEQELTLTVVLPGGVEKTTVVHGSKPMMDLLVMLCAKYHLNPSSHTIELITTYRNHVKFKPNTPVGALDAEKILLKPKGQDDKSKKTWPQMPEATVRLVINYRKTQKTILRVNPRVPLRELLPAICEKCEFDLQTTVLKLNVHSEDTLDLSCSLNDFGLREVYARDTKVLSPVSPPPSPIGSEIIQHGKDKIQREKENKGLFGLFRKGSRKQSEQSMTVSAPASPVHKKQRPVSMSSFSTYSPMYDSNTMPSDTPKKRRAPLPPSMMSQSMPTDLGHHQGNAQTTVHPEGSQNTASLSRGSSTESSLKKASTKRKAPPPPSLTNTTPPDETTQDRGMTEPVLASPLEGIKEQEEVRVGSVEEEILEDDSSLNLSADISLDSGRAGTTSPSQDSELESASPHGRTRENPLSDMATDAEIAESTVNGEGGLDQVVSTNVQSGEMEPQVEGREVAIQSSESGPLLEEVSAGLSETATSPLTTSLTSDCGIQTSHTHTDSQIQCLDSNIATQQAVPQASPEPSHSRDQMEKPNLGPVNFTHTETQTQTEPQIPPKESPSSFCTEPSTALAPSSSTGLKKDMATSTEELHVPESQPTTVQPPKGPATTPALAATKAGSVQYIVDAEPKPKPSNELTREYIPKVGMTTYTIVPQKSLEKLRFFEVELTLEPRSDAVVESLDCKPEVKTETGPAQPQAHQTHSFPPPPGNPPQLPNGTMSLNGHQSYSRKVTELTQTLPPASPTANTSSPSSPFEDGTKSPVKDKKVPPATRPKPASFRLPLHKRTPGDYVTSAATRRASVGSSSSSSPCSSPAGMAKEIVGSPTAVQENFPPPPPPVQWEGAEEHPRTSDIPAPVTQQEQVDGPKPEPHSKNAEAFKFPPSSVLPRQQSLPTSPTPSLSLEKLRSFAAPKPYSPSTPSRFAQAVSSAVKKSHSLSHNPLEQSQRQLPRHPLIKQSSISESPEPPTNTVTDNGEGHRERYREAPSQTAGRGDPASSSTQDGDMGTWI